jgi:putative ABC transport system ATP-binding protein
MENVVKTYGAGETAVHALKGVSLCVYPGEVVGLVGASGSGKTTLLQCLGAIIDPTSGLIELGGEVIYDNGWKKEDLRALRRDKIGFVFQAAYLIPFLDMLDNVAIMPMLAGKDNDKARARAMELLKVLEVTTGRGQNPQKYQEANSKESRSPGPWQTILRYTGR